VTSPWVKTIKKPTVLLSIGAIVLVIILWLVLFFVPQSHKLSSLRSQQASLNSLIQQDNARMQRLRTETHHLGQIRSMYSTLENYVPSTQGLYTYVHTISAAGKSAGINITSISPGAPVAASGTPYTAIPITAAIKGSYTELRNFLQGIYALPRLTDVNAISLNMTGGTGGELGATLQMAIFTSQKATGSS
jgi:type IV pilus assembly protein PilO